MSRVLLVEDEATIARLVSTLLTREGYAVEVATTLREATTALGGSAPDIMLLDGHLGGEDTLQALPSLRELAPQSVCIGLSGSIEEQTVAAWFEAGAAGYITKPFEPRQLARRVAEIAKRASDQLRPLRFVPGPYVSPKALSLAPLSDDTVLRELLNAAAALFGMPIALVVELDAQLQHLRVKVGLDISSTPREVALCAYTVASREPVFVVEDTSLDARFADNPLVTGYPSIRFYAGAALRWPGGGTGAVCFIDRVPRKLSPEQDAFLRALAAHIAALAQARISASAEAELGLLRHVGDWVEVTDASGRIKSVNDAWQRGLAYTSPVGASVFDLVCDEDRERVRRVLSSGQRVGETFQVAHDRIRAGGGRVTVEALTRWVGRGDDLRAVTSLRDVTAARKRERDRESFLSTLAEQLRSPLRTLHGTLGLLAGMPMAQEEADLLAAALDDSGGMERLIDDWLDLESASVGTLRLKVRVVSVSDVVADAARVLGLRCRAKGVTIDVDAPTGANVRGDRDRLVQVALNVLSHAVHRAPRGGRVRVVVTEDESVVRVVVDDDVPLTRAGASGDPFVPFGLVGAEPTPPGAGLSLALARALVELHGGACGVEARATGSRLWTSLPAEPAERSDTSSPYRDFLAEAERELRQGVLDALPADVEKLRSCARGELDDARRTSARRIAHRIRGSAGSAGFSDVAAAARAIERVLDAWREDPTTAAASLSSAIEHLASLVAQLG